MSASAVPFALVRTSGALTTLKPLIPRVYLPTFLASFGQGMLIPTLPLFVRDLGVNFTLVTLAVAMAGLGTLAWNVPAGLLLARTSERRIQIVGMSVMAAATVLLAFTESYALVIAFRALAGVGLSMWSLSRMTFMLRMAPSHQRGRVMSLFGGVNRIAVFASPVVGGALADLLGFGPAFFIAGLVMSIGVVPTLLYREPASAHRPVLGRRPGWHQIGEVVRNHRHDLLTAGTGQIFAATIRSGRQVVVPLYAAFVLDLDATAVGVAVSASAAIDMTLFPLAGYVMDRFGRRFATVPSFALFGVSMALLPLARDFTGLILIGLLMGLANGIGSGSMLTLSTDLAPKDSPAQFLGVWRLIGDIGHSGGPLLVGTVADLIGLALAPFFLAAVGLAGALMFAFVVRETLERPKPAPVSTA